MTYILDRRGALFAYRLSAKQALTVTFEQSNVESLLSASLWLFETSLADSLQLTATPSRYLLAAADASNSSRSSRTKLFVMAEDDLYRCTADDTGILGCRRLFDRSFSGCLKFEVWKSLLFILTPASLVVADAGAVGDVRIIATIDVDQFRR